MTDERRNAIASDFVLRPTRRGVLKSAAGLALFGDMAVAMITVTWATGLHQVTPPGYELNVALAALGLVVALLGAGRYSLDALAERRLVATGE